MMPCQQGRSAASGDVRGPPPCSQRYSTISNEIARKDISSDESLHLHLRRCTFCATTAIGDERHCVFDCPHFQGLRQQHAEIFRNSHDAMRSVMWHKDQKSVCALVLAIVNEA